MPIFDAQLEAASVVITLITLIKIMLLAWSHQDGFNNRVHSSEQIILPSHIYLVAW